MKVVPDAKTSRYKDVKAGHLFLCKYLQTAQYFLKCSHKAEDDEVNYRALNLGPDFSPDTKHMQIYGNMADGTVVIDYGKNFIVEVNNSQKNILFEKFPSLGDPGNWLVLTGDRHYIRADSGHRSPQFSECFVCLETGEFLYDLPAGGCPVMVTAWSIRLAGTDDLLEKIPDPIVKVPSDPPQ